MDDQKIKEAFDIDAHIDEAKDQVEFARWTRNKYCGSGVYGSGFYAGYKAASAEMEK